MTTPISAEGLVRRFGDDTVVADMTLEVPEGTIQGFVGPSGSGKTTTVRMLTGVLDPSAGTARVLGEDPRRLGTADRRRIGYMPQLGVLYPHLRVVDNLRFVASLWGVDAPKDRIAELLDLLGLEGAAGRRLRDCSGGMQRRVALAAALMHGPDVLFLDEPTSGLDPVLRARLWEHFGELRDAGRTLFVTTQIVSEATMCDRVGLIADGRLLADDTPEALRRLANGGEVVTLRAPSRIPTEVLDPLTRHDRVVEVSRVGTDGRVLRVVVEDLEADVEALRTWLAERDVQVVSERQVDPFDDVFVALLEAQR